MVLVHPVKFRIVSDQDVIKAHSFAEKLRERLLQESISNRQLIGAHKGKLLRSLDLLEISSFDIIAKLGRILRESQSVRANNFHWQLSSIQFLHSLDFRDPYYISVFQVVAL